MIGGNCSADLQTRTVTRNAIGEQVESWTTVHTLTGFLDYQSGDSKYTTYAAKIQESTHMFICDYVELDIKAENSRMLVNGGRYDIVLIDDPMGLHRHLEIFLKFTGGQ